MSSAEKDSSLSTMSEAVMQPATPQSFGDNSSLQITSHKLDGKNFLQWSRSVLLVIRGRGEMGYITGEIQRPALGDSTYGNWELNNSIVMAWLINSMESHISRTYLFLRTAKAIWDAVNKNYSDLENASQPQRILPPLTSLVGIMETIREEDVRGAVTAINHATPEILAGIFTELESGKTIGSARVSGGLYYFEDKDCMAKQATTVNFSSVSNNDDLIMLWHRRKQPLNSDKPKSLQGQESELIPSPDEQVDDHTHHDGTDHSIQKGDDCGELDTLKLYLASEFELKDLGALRYFLGMEVTRSKSGITVSQRKYVLDLLRDTGMLGCRSIETPMEPNAKLDIEGGKDVDREQYQRLVGKLIYLSHTRPDIAFAVSVISQFMHSPKKKHLDAVYGVLRELIQGVTAKWLAIAGDDTVWDTELLGELGRSSDLDEDLEFETW
ncbi:hypothetical protein RJ639_015215 [Escallonia herrerae]|uniref:Retrotransposon Copia-like N-terminal domain-containing protein n=1 Tax=Escallonia herrerae TaxID=1293975 RepID=A0AA88VIC3_9ASTE|nr:hypothetical protein RJ639_015215 [Escallonia herrerae]